MDMKNLSHENERSIINTQKKKRKKRKGKIFNFYVFVLIFYRGTFFNGILIEKCFY